MGKQVQSTVLNDAISQLSTAHLGNGLYIYQVLNADGRVIANGKLIKH